jgi:hypothetical protein
MAFPGRTIRQDVMALRLGVEVAFVVTQSVYGKPWRDKTEVIGTAVVQSTVRAVRPPVEISGREFGSECDIELTVLSRPRDGVELRALVPQKISTSREWKQSGAALRRPLVPITAADVMLLTAQLEFRKADTDDAIERYALLASAISR